MHRVSSALVWGFGLVIAAVGASAAQGGDAAARKLKNPVASSSTSIAAGQALYLKNCRSCHGREGKGDGAMAGDQMKPADLTDAKWVRGASDGEIFAVIRDGAGPDFKMKGYKGRLTDNDMWTMVTYLKSLSKPK